MRKTPLVTNHIYHVFNRGVNKYDIFFSQKDFSHFLSAAKHYIAKNSKFSYEKPFLKPNSEYNDTGSSRPKVEILAYCLMPNHFHFLIKQVSDNGITSYMRRLLNSYVHYINIKNKRVGPLFQGRFKAVSVDSDEHLLHVSRYIHLNPLVSNLVTDLKNYSWSSYANYLEGRDDGLVKNDLILGMFKTGSEYEKFVLDQADYARSLEQLKHLEGF